MTYKAQNFLFRTSIGHYSLTKGIFEMQLLKREQCLSEVLQKHQSSVIYSFILIHSVMNGFDKNVHSMHCFHMKRGRWDTLSFFKRGNFKVSYLSLTKLMVLRDLLRSRVTNQTAFDQKISIRLLKSNARWTVVRDYQALIFKLKTLDTITFI